MSNSRKIVFATDFSDSSLRAGEVATEWALAIDAELHWVHCTERMLKALAPSAVPLLTSYVDRALTYATEQIRVCAENSREVGLVSEAHVVNGAPGEAVLKVAEEIEAFAVVLGSHGHTGLKRIWLGSVAEGIVRDAACDVLVVRGPDSPFSGATILVGDDLTPYSTPARTVALEIAKHAGAPIEFLHSLDLGILYLSNLEVVVPSTLFKEAYDEAAERLAEAAQRAGDVNIANRVVGDRAAAVLCERAETLHAGLVVVGSHSREGITRSLLGSVAQKLVRHAPCSVLVARGAFGEHE